MATTTRLNAADFKHTAAAYEAAGASEKLRYSKP